MSDDKTYTKADLDAAIADANKALETKRDELLNEVRDLKASLRKTQEIKPEDFAALEAENDKLKGDLAKAHKDLGAASKALETANKALETETGATRKLLVENGLREQLAANGVTNAVHQKAAMALLASGVEIVADGDARVAKVGDKALADFVKEWAGGDEGKHFVAAPNNRGGGAPGGQQNGGGVKTVTRDQFNTMSHAERSTFAKDGGKVVDAAA